MDKKTYRFIVELYLSRGIGLDDAQWADFSAWCSRNGYDYQPFNIGTRVDGRNPWDVWEEKC